VNRKTCFTFLGGNPTGGIIRENRRAAKESAENLCRKGDRTVGAKSFWMDGDYRKRSTTPANENGSSKQWVMPGKDG